MADAAEARMMNVVSTSTERAESLRDEFSELFAATYSRVVRTTWFVVHDQAMAEEIAQDAFTDLYRDWSRLRDFQRWLCPRSEPSCDSHRGHCHADER